MTDMTEIPLAELIEDAELYPRHAVDSTNVAALAEALRAGDQLPPIIADRRSKRIVDGWHRYRAYKQVHGTDGTIPVELRNYRNDAEIVQDAIRLNSAHGRRLDRMDQTRAILMLERHKVPVAQIACILHITQERITTLRVNVTISPCPNNAQVPQTKKMVLKRSVQHMAGKTLTREQAKACESLPGTSLVLTAKQLRMALENDLIDEENEKMMDELKLLYQALGDFLHPVEAN